MAHEVFTEAQLFGAKNVTGYPELPPKPSPLESHDSSSTRQSTVSTIEGGRSPSKTRARRHNQSNPTGL